MGAPAAFLASDAAAVLTGHVVHADVGYRIVAG